MIFLSVLVGSCLVLVQIVAAYVTVGGEQGGHGFTSRPRETLEEPALDKLLFLFGYLAVCGW